MQWLLLSVLGVLFFIILLTIIPVYITIRYQKDRHTDNLSMELRFLRRIHFTFKVPLSNAKTSAQSDKQDASTALQPFRWIFSLFYTFLEGHSDAPSVFEASKFSLIAASAVALTRECRLFRWKTQIGLGDAAATAWAAGVVWGIKGGIMAFLGSRIRFHRTPTLEVMPDFSQTGLSIWLHCIFRVNVGHIIIVGIRNLLKVGMLKGVKAVGK